MKIKTFSWPNVAEIHSSKFSEFHLRLLVVLRPLIIHEIGQKQIEYN